MASLPSLVVWLVLGTLLSAGCRHVAWTRGTFEHPAGTDAAAGSPALVLRVSRHLDLLVSAPDIEEDQSLVLEIAGGYRLGERLPVPSGRVAARFVATRFGPRSQGEEFTGFVIVREVTAERVAAYLNVQVVARTRDRSYTQQDHFQGDLVFVPQRPRR